MTSEYKSTVFLPRTKFPMKGNLPQRELEILQKWNTMDLYSRLREQSSGQEKFILHDGPPYANGHIHIGHAVNKILKDIINRGWQMLGYDANYVPGWDCHGLPIEWNLEKHYRATHKDKNTIPITEFRGDCRAFAEKWQKIQSEEFQRLGVIGNWNRPYTTMTPSAEAQIVRELHHFAINGSLYRGSKPILWSVVERTALAGAEVEYHDHRSTTAWVRFPVIETYVKELNDVRQDAQVSIVIWTTTPWTLPGNRAIAYGNSITYGLYKVCSSTKDKGARTGEYLVISTALADQVAAQHASAQGEYINWKREATFQGAVLENTICAHPLRGHGYDFPVPLYQADFVTTDMGTGFVHIAPGHGEDDYLLGMQHQLEIPETIGEDGSFYDHIPLFAGRDVYTDDGTIGDANQEVLKTLTEVDALLTQGHLNHSYPHSWRSKAPLIFRTTPQWFLSMEHNDLRHKALRGIDNTIWIPAESRNRLRSMIESRPDWCISRQRTWGVPIAIFVHKQDGTLLTDPEVLTRITDIFEKEGTDAWFTYDAQEFLGSRYDTGDFEQVRDIVDVWFESGSTHSFVLESRSELTWPASLYLEGSDQHRGWFHSSLLHSCGTRGCPPYKAVLTHGFTLDSQGRKMSKSLNNVIAPQAINDTYGADILRLWVVSSNYFADLRIGPDILKHHSDLYRRLRNTLRYLLGALDGYTATERIENSDEMPELERWILHRLVMLDQIVCQGIKDNNFHRICITLHNFCTTDLSGFYFDVRKDSLYCDVSDSLCRRSVRTVMQYLFSCLTAWLAPFLCFTTEEAWHHCPPDIDPLDGSRDGLLSKTIDSVHLRRFPELPYSWRNDGLVERWQYIWALRSMINKALERARGDKDLGSSLDAAPIIYVTPKAKEVLKSLDLDLNTIALQDLMITSAVTIVESDQLPEDSEIVTSCDDLGNVDVTVGIGVKYAPAIGKKCQRCWKVLPEVGIKTEFPTLCQRCINAITTMMNGNQEQEHCR